MYRNNVLAESLPFAKKSIITVMIKAKIIEEIAPETIPLKLVILAESNPQKKAPSKTLPMKNAFTESVIVCEFVNMYEKNKEIISVMITPITDDNTMPVTFFAVEDISVFFFITFLRIKKSLTFNKEYEGNLFIMKNYSSSFLDFLVFFSALFASISAFAASRSA